ncbi:MAG: VCBS repeat-containing protein, partial [Thermoanaerobaculia bacterium]|nr:VCBS repeat-containing protein [Thermoanaerobaculia bacterium]
GDGRPDLVWRHARDGWRRPWVSEGRGEGRFDAPRALFEETEDRASESGDGDEGDRAIGSEKADHGAHETDVEGTSGEDELGSSEGLVGDVLAFADLDGRGRAEVATVQEDPEPGDLGMRKSIDWAESPPGTLQIYETTPDLKLSPSPRITVRIEGYAGAGGDSDIRLPGGFRDLDGDGRQDLITLSLGISITRLLGGLALGRVTLPMDFHLWCQESEGVFRRVEGLDLSGRFRVDIRNLEVWDLPSFEGDFDGDGRFDFVQLGRGREISVHRGAPGCRFPSRPDLEISLRAEPAHTALVRVEDLDGDGRSDLVVTHPLEGNEPAMVPPTRLDVYLSGAGSPR